jgi:hypothetical protein
VDAFANILQASHRKAPKISPAAAGEENEFGEFSDFSSAPAPSIDPFMPPLAADTAPRGVSRDRPLDMGLFEEFTAPQPPTATAKSIQVTHAPHSLFV